MVGTEARASEKSEAQVDVLTRSQIAIRTETTPVNFIERRGEEPS